MSENQALVAALEYASRGWPVIPLNPDTRRPCFKTGSEHGIASTDPAQLRNWWRKLPTSYVGGVMGARADLAVVDVDFRTDGNGLDTLEELGVTTNPTTPTGHTPHGGLHWFFKHPGGYVKSLVGRHGIGPHVDIRADGSYVVLPPRPGAFWDPHLGLDTPLAEWPAWARVREPDPPKPAASRPNASIRLSRYGEAALDAAVERIVRAAAGEQRTTVNAEAYSIGRLVGGQVLPSDLALKSLLWAAAKVPSTDPHRPWRPSELSRIVESAFIDGLRNPRDGHHG